MKITLPTTGQRAVALGGLDSVTDDVLTTEIGECAVTYADIAPFTVGAVCAHGKTAVSGTVQNALRLLKRKHVGNRLPAQKS
jgi:hypothetical protein